MKTRKQKLYFTNYPLLYKIYKTTISLPEVALSYLRKIQIPLAPIKNWQELQRESCFLDRMCSPKDAFVATLRSEQLREPRPAHRPTIKSVQGEPGRRMNGRMHEWLAVLTEAETNRSRSASTRILIPFLRNCAARVLVDACTCPAELHRSLDAPGSIRSPTDASMKPSPEV